MQSIVHPTAPDHELQDRLGAGDMGFSYGYDYLKHSFQPDTMWHILSMPLLSSPP